MCSANCFILSLDVTPFGTPQRDTRLGNVEGLALFVGDRVIPIRQRGNQRGQILIRVVQSCLQVLRIIHRLCHSLRLRGGLTQFAAATAGTSIVIMRQ